MIDRKYGEGTAEFFACAIGEFYKSGSIANTSSYFKAVRQKFALPLSIPADRYSNNIQWRHQAFFNSSYTKTHPAGNSGEHAASLGMT